jgi:PqqD family protein of HPr-rel-A system
MPRFAFAPHAVIRPLDNAWVIFDAVSGDTHFVHACNDPVIRLLLKGPHSVDEILTELHSGGDTDTPEPSVIRAFLDGALQAGIVLDQ